MACLTRAGTPVYLLPKKATPHGGRWAAFRVPGRRAGDLTVVSVYGYTGLGPAGRNKELVQEIAEFTRVCEQHVGTMSGGMDQAISVMGERGLAKLIEFGPVRASDVVLPPGCRSRVDAEVRSRPGRRAAPIGEGASSERRTPLELIASCIA